MRGAPRKFVWKMKQSLEIKKDDGTEVFKEVASLPQGLGIIPDNIFHVLQFSGNYKTTSSLTFTSMAFFGQTGLHSLHPMQVSGLI